MAVETRVIIDANASNAIREIGKLDDAAGDADKTLDKLDGATVDVDTSDAVSGLDDIDTAAGDAKGELDKLDAQTVTVKADASFIADVEAKAAALRAETGTPYEITFDVDADKLDTVKHKADDIDSSGRAASTAIGGLGNTVSELPGVGGLGAMAESMGQLAEGALEGEISVGKLAATAGGLALVGIAAKAITGHMEKMAAAKAFNADQVQAWSSALREGETLLGAINDELATTGKLEFQGFTDVVDVVPLLAKAGLTVDDWTAAVEGNEQAQKDLLTVMRGSIGDGDAMVNVMFALGNATENYNNAEEARANVLKVSSREQDKSTAGVVDAAIAAAEHAVALGEAAGATAELEAANKKLRGDLNNREAYLNVQSSLDELGAAGIQAMEDVASGAVDAETATRNFELQQIAAKEEVLDYIDQIGNIPPEKETEILALIDQGKLTEAEAMLDGLDEPREVEIRFKWDQAKLNELNRSIPGGIGMTATTRLTGMRH